MGWQKEFDVDSANDIRYKIYLVDAINSAQNFDFSILENITDQDVSFRRRNATPGKLMKGTPFIITSNLPPAELFGPIASNNLGARAMICNIADIELQVAELSSILLKWVDCNGLSLNLKKTTFMIFSRRKIPDNEINIKIGNTVIERKVEARFLGVIMDEKLKWTAHICAVKNKMSRYIGIMYKIKHCLPLKARIQIYHSFV